MPIVIRNYYGFVPREEKANGFETAGDKTHFFFSLPSYQFVDEVITTGAQNRVGLIFSR